MAVNTDPLYNTPDTPDVNPKSMIAPSPQLESVVPFMENPKQFINNRPDLEFKFKPPTERPDKGGTEQSLIKSLIAGAQKQAANQAYNKFSKTGTAYDRNFAAAYDDPELGFQADRDNDAIYDANQSWYGDIARNSLGFGANLVGTFAQTISQTPMLISNVFDWIGNDFDSEAFSKVYDNPIGRSISDWMDDVQQSTQNFRGEREREVEKNPLLNLIPFYGNGLGDAYRSLGYGAGAVAGVLAEEAVISLATSGVGTFPTLAAEIGKLYKISSLGQRGLNVAKASSDLARVASAVNTTGTLARVGRAAWAGKLGVRNVLSSLGEASFEALETQKSLELEMVEKFRREKGYEPSQDDRAAIKRATIEAGNARYGLNVALLSVTNAIEFDALFKTFPISKYLKNESAKVATELGEKGFQEIVPDAVGTTAGKSWYKTFANTSWKALKSNAAIAPMEGFEEGAQTAIDKATGYYAQEKYNGRGETINALDAALHGLKETLSTSEGWNAILQGMVAGGIQQVVTNKLTDFANRNAPTQAQITNQLLTGLNPLITDAEGNTDYNAVKTLLNLNSLGGTAQSKIDHAASMVGSQKGAQQAVLGDDQKLFQDYKDSIQFAFLNQFIRTNQTEAMDHVLNGWEELAETDLKTFKEQFQIDTPQSDLNSIKASLNNLRKKGRELKTIYDNINASFPNKFKAGSEQYDQYERYRIELTNQLFRHNRFQERYTDLQNKIGGYTHLQDAFKGKEFVEKLTEEKRQIETQLSIPTPTDGGEVFTKLNRELKERLKTVNDSLTLLEKDTISENEVQELMFKTDRIFGEDRLRRELNSDSILKDVSDIIRLQENSEAAVEIYRKLTDAKGFEDFQEIEQDAEQAAQETRDAQAKEREAENAKKEKEAADLQKKQNVASRFNQQLQALADVTGTPLNDLVDQFVSEGNPSTDEAINQFVANRASQINAPVTSVTQTEEEGELESADVDPDEMFYDEGEDESETTESVDVDPDEMFYEDDLSVDPLEQFRTGQRSVEGKFIRYISGSGQGTQDYRYVQKVTSQNQGRIKADVIEFENGVAVNKGNKEFNLADETKLLEVIDSLPAYEALIRDLLAPPVVPPVQEIASSAPLANPKPLAYFQNFFSTSELQKRAILSPQSNFTIGIAEYKGKPVGETVIFNNGTISIRSARSQNLKASKDGVYTFSLNSEAGTLGYFRPLSSFIVKDASGEETLYDIVGRSLTQPNALDKIAGAIAGDIKDLQFSYRLESFFKNAAKEGKTEITPAQINSLLGNNLIIKPYYRGVTYARTDDNKLPLLNELLIDRKNAFIWEDSQVSYLFNETDSNLDIPNVLNQFSNLFTGDGFTQSTLSSYLLFFQDSTGAWNTVPVRTIPVTSTGYEQQVVENNQRIQEFQGTNEELVKLLNSNFFYQSNTAKGNFVHSNGKVQFLLQSLFKEQLSYKDEKANPKDAEQIRITVPIDSSSFTIEGFYESIKDQVATINKKGTTQLKFNLDDFRIQPIGERGTAEDFGNYRVMVSSPSVFDTVTMGYQAGTENYTIPDSHSTPEEVLPTVPTIEVTEQSTVENILEPTNTTEVKETPTERESIEAFFRTYPDEKSQLAALRREHKSKAGQVLKQMKQQLGERIDLSTAEGINKLANQDLKASDIFPQSDEEFVPSLKLSNTQLDFLVQKALRECK